MPTVHATALTALVCQSTFVAACAAPATRDTADEEELFVETAVVIVIGKAVFGTAGSVPIVQGGVPWAMWHRLPGQSARIKVAADLTTRSVYHKLGRTEARSALRDLRTAIGNTDNLEDAYPAWRNLLSSRGFRDEKAQTLWQLIQTYRFIEPSAYRQHHAALSELWRIGRNHHASVADLVVDTERARELASVITRTVREHPAESLAMQMSRVQVAQIAHNVVSDTTVKLETAYGRYPALRSQQFVEERSRLARLTGDCSQSALCNELPNGRSVISDRYHRDDVCGPYSERRKQLPKKCRGSSCAEVKGLMRRIAACILGREVARDTCYSGVSNPGHRVPLRDAYSLWEKCIAKYERFECSPSLDTAGGRAPAELERLKQLASSSICAPP